jgi:cytochrome c oxidase subunit 3
MQHWNVLQGWAAWGLGLVQLIFLVNLVWSWRRGARTDDNPWEATTLEWSTTSPPPAHNFACQPRVVRGAYEYSVPGEDRDFSPQGSTEPSAPGTLLRRPETGTSSARLGMWLFIASEVMLFGGLFSAYVLLRTGASHWGHEASIAALPAGLGFTAVLAIATIALIRRTRAGLALASLAGVLFLVVKGWSYAAAWGAGLVPATSTFAALYYLITGVHALHVLGGVVVAAYLAIRWTASTDGDAERLAGRIEGFRMYWYLVDVVWLCVLAAFYLY